MLGSQSRPSRGTTPVARKPVDPDEAKARKILLALSRLERAERRRRYSVSLVWLVTLLLVLAIVVVVIVNRERLLMLWTHLSRPDSIPGIGQ